VARWPAPRACQVSTASAEPGLGGLLVAHADFQVLARKLYALASAKPHRRSVTLPSAAVSCQPEHLSGIDLCCGSRSNAWPVQGVQLETRARGSPDDELLAVTIDQSKDTVRIGDGRQWHVSTPIFFTVGLQVSRNPAVSMICSACHQYDMVHGRIISRVVARQFGERWRCLGQPAHSTGLDSAGVGVCRAMNYRHAVTAACTPPGPTLKTCSRS